MALSSCFDPTTCVFSSPRAPIQVPPNLDMISFLFSHTTARSFHHRFALVDAVSGRGFTFLQFQRHVYAAARALSFLGIKQYDVVLIFSPNSVHFPVLFFAIISLGAIATTINPACLPAEIHKQMEDSKVKLILAVPELVEKVTGSALPVVLIDDCEPMSATAVTAKPSKNPLLSEVIKRAGNHRVPPVKIEQTDTAALLYSSGTTGMSKGVILSHRNFITAALQATQDADLHGERDLTCLMIIPMFHVYGLVIVYGHLQKGNTLIMMPKFDFLHMLQAVERYRITNLPVVPPIMIGLAKHEAVTRFDLSSVTEMLCGAAPIGRDTLEQVHHRLQSCDIRQGYGMTETTAVASIAFFKSAEKNFSTVGPLVSGMEAVVVDLSSGKRLPPNEHGEIWLRGPSVMQGYFNKPEATAATLDKDGWLHTGDIGHFDDKGNLYIIDRLKELIKYKGLQVAPAELEALLLRHPEIVDAAVVPCPDAEAGEVPLAYVVRLPRSSLSEQDIIKFVALQVAPYKKVRQVKFINEIPKSAAGKILRRQLTKSLPSKL